MKRVNRWLYLLFQSLLQVLVVMQWLVVACHSTQVQTAARTAVGLVCGLFVLSWRAVLWPQHSDVLCCAALLLLHAAVCCLVTARREGVLCSVEFSLLQLSPVIQKDFQA